MTRVRVKNGTEANRGKVVPGLGEWIYAVDSKRTYMGDGETPGGVAVNTKHHEVATTSDIAEIKHALDGDTCDTSDTGDVYMLVNGTWINIHSQGQQPIVWHNATLNTGWANSGGDLPPVRYAKQGNLVLLEGGCGRNNNDDIIFTLPAEYRPTYDTIKPVFGHSGIMRLDIKKNGDVVLQTNGQVDWVAFNIQFAIGGVTSE